MPAHKLDDYLILDPLPEQAKGDAVSLAAQICGTPFTLITLVDSDGEWIKAKKASLPTKIPGMAGRTHQSSCTRLSRQFQMHAP